MTRLGNVQRSETRRETRASLLTALLWFASAVIVFAMLLRMLPNSLDGKRYVPLIVALMPWLGLLSVIIAIRVFRQAGVRWAYACRLASAGTNRSLRGRGVGAISAHHVQ